MDETREKRNKVIKITGERLLQGWKMLALLCPVCDTALLSKSDEMYCACCNLPVRHESPPTNDEKVAAKPIVQSSSVTSAAPSANATAIVTKNTSNRTSSVSSLLGEKMLLGWTMTMYSCPDDNAPLMKEPNSAATALCVACNDTYHISVDGKVSRSDTTVVPPVVATSAITADNTLYNDDERIDKFPSRSQNSKTEDPIEVISEKLSKKMLQGWSMLNKCCSSIGCTDNIPLMRNPNNQQEEYCVGCGSTVSLSNDRSGKIGGSVVATSQSNVYKRSQLVQKKNVIEDHLSDVDDIDEEEYVEVVDACNSEKYALRILRMKLKEASKELHQLAMFDDMEKTSKIVDLMTKLAHAISTTKSIF